MQYFTISIVFRLSLSYYFPKERFKVILFRVNAFQSFSLPARFLNEQWKSFPSTASRGVNFISEYVQWVFIFNFLHFQRAKGVFIYISRCLAAKFGCLLGRLITSDEKDRERPPHLTFQLHFNFLLFLLCHMRQIA